jgi:hypothetical protein
LPDPVIFWRVMRPFLDPLSSGVHLATFSGMLAAANFSMLAAK